LEDKKLQRIIALPHSLAEVNIKGGKRNSIIASSQKYFFATNAYL
jgi:hypothetical protein